MFYRLLLVLAAAVIFVHCGKAHHGKPKSSPVITSQHIIEFAA